MRSLKTKAKRAREWVHRSYPLWKQWAAYPVRKALVPEHQLCTDDFAGPLASQTTLALKGIIVLRAMSDLSKIVGEGGDSQYYLNISRSYIKKWEDYGISRDQTHAKLSYTWLGSWATIYNIYADTLLCFHLPEKEEKQVLGQPGMIQASVEQRESTGITFIPDRVY